MVKHMLSLPYINDPQMDDGTTAFSMALARKDLDLIRVLLASKHYSDIDHVGLAQRAVLEIDRDSRCCNPKLRQELVNSLKQVNESSNKEVPIMAKLSQE